MRKLAEPFLLKAIIQKDAQWRLALKHAIEEKTNEIGLNKLHCRPKLIPVISYSTGYAGLVN